MALPILHIILVDDDLDDLRLFQEALDAIHLSTELTLLASGQELMDYLDLPDAEIPDLIFLDLKMPVVSGLDCLKAIRTRPAWKNSSIAIYSNLSSEKSIEEAFMEGANIYIEKPDGLSELRKVLEKVLQINWQYHTSNLDRNNFLFRI